MNWPDMKKFAAKKWPVSCYNAGLLRFYLPERIYRGPINRCS